MDLFEVLYPGADVTLVCITDEIGWPWCRPAVWPVAFPVYDDDRKASTRIEPGFIYTIPSEVSGQNDCIHATVDGRAEVNFCPIKHDGKDDIEGKQYPYWDVAGTHFYDATFVNGNWGGSSSGLHYEGTLNYSAGTDTSSVRGYFRACLVNSTGSKVYELTERMYVWSVESMTRMTYTSSVVYEPESRTVDVEYTTKCKTDPAYITTLRMTNRPDNLWIGLDLAILYEDLHLECLSALLQVLFADTASTQQQLLDNVPLIDSNWIENLVGADLSSVVPPVDLIRGFQNRDPAEVLKGASSAYLWYKYIISNDVRDVVELLDKRKEIISRLRARNKKRDAFRARDSYSSFGWNFLITASCVLDPQIDNISTRIYSKLDDLGLALTLRRLWDVVPYSFVVDWFTNLSGILSSIDSYMQRRYDVNRVIVGRKAWRILRDEISALCPSFDVHECTAKAYFRTCSRSFPISALRTKGGWSRHSLEGGALIVGRL